MEEEILYIQFARLILRVNKNDQLYGLNIPNIKWFIYPLDLVKLLIEKITVSLFPYRNF